MNPQLIGALAGAGLGALNYGNKNKAAKEQQKLEAAKTLYSPWTGMQGQYVQAPDAIGEIVKGASMGMGMGQNFQSMTDASNIKSQQMENLSGGEGGSQEVEASRSPASVTPANSVSWGDLQSAMTVTPSSPAQIVPSNMAVPAAQGYNAGNNAQMIPSNMAVPSAQGYNNVANPTINQGGYTLPSTIPLTNTGFQGARTMPQTPVLNTRRLR